MRYILIIEGQLLFLCDPKQYQLIYAWEDDDSSSDRTFEIIAVCNLMHERFRADFGYGVGSIFVLKNITVNTEILS